MRVLILVAAVITMACSTIEPPTGPHTDFPCGVGGVVCASGTCCPNDYTCGGPPPSVGCPADQCCYLGTGLEMRRNIPQRRP